MIEKEPLEVRDNVIPSSIDWGRVSEVQVWGWANEQTNKFLDEALRLRKKAVRPMDADAKESREKAVSIDERPVRT